MYIKLSFIVFSTTLMFKSLLKKSLSIKIIENVKKLKSSYKRSIKKIARQVLLSFC